MRMRYGPQRGINLIELLIVVAVATVSLVAGIPGFAHLVTRMERTTAIMDLTASVQLARSEAARRSTPVSICASTDGSACSAADNRDWSEGWLVFADDDADAALDTGEDLLAVVHFNDPRFTLTADSAVGASVLVRADGFVDQDSVGTLGYCDAYDSRDLNFNYTGRLGIDVTNSPCP